MTTTATTAIYAQAYTSPPKHPTAAEVESYRQDAHETGMREARDYLVGGSPMLAFLAVVAATEAEARIVGYGGHRIPVMDAVKRLPSGRVRKAVPS